MSQKKKKKKKNTLSVIKCLVSLGRPVGLRVLHWPQRQRENKAVAVQICPGGSDITRSVNLLHCQGSRSEKTRPNRELPELELPASLRPALYKGGNTEKVCFYRMPTSGGRNQDMAQITERQGRIAAAADASSIAPVNCLALQTVL